MTNRILFAVCFLMPGWVLSQYTFNNKGASIYVQKNALVHVQGNFINDSSTTTSGVVKNDGIIEIKGDFENKTNASFAKHTDNTSFERAVKFIGTGSQSIKGNMSTSGSASFYNLIIDKGSSSDSVKMETAVNVDGSLIFGTSTTTTYNPSSSYTSNSKKGLLKTYNSSTSYLLNITNGDTGAIAGYPSLVMNGSPSTGFILTKGSRGSANGGLQRKISVTAKYHYPIGTTTNGFNGVTLNFTSIPNSTGSVKGKFNDGTDNPTGYVGQIDSQCISCPGASNPPPGLGYNQHFNSAPCNGPEWLALDDAILDHGYWSFVSAENNNNYTYSVEAFPNSFTAEGDLGSDIFRVIRHDSSSYSYNPTNSSWNPFISQVVNASDLVTYTKNAGLCYAGNGIPGGRYTAFGHFALSSSKTGGGSLPVELLYINAEPIDNTIRVFWATAVEINNMGFFVERSTDGVQWQQIGWVDGNNNSTLRIDYHYDDINVSTGVRYYYRLKQVDFDGAFEYTDITTALINAETTFQLNGFVPNPALGKTILHVTSAIDAEINVELHDLTGRKVLSATYALSKGANRINFDVSRFAAGTYTAVVKGSEVYTQKLVITN